MKKFFSLAMAVCASAMLFAGNLYKVDFTGGQGKWTIEDKEIGTLSYVWKQDSQYGMKGSAYANKSSNAAESWLISPSIDLTAAKSATLKVNQAVNKGLTTNLKVKVSTDDGKTWEDVTIGMPAGDSWNFQDDSISINAYVGKSIKLAFVYVSTTSVCPTWEIKTVTIYEGEESAGEDEQVEIITVAEAITLCEAMETSSYSTKKYCVTGIVTTAYDYSTQYKNQTFYFGADEKAEKGATIEAYRAVVAAPGVKVGDKVAVTGKIGVRKTSSGNRSLGFAEGCTVEIIPATAVEDVNAESVKAVKVIEDGQLVIIRDNVRYNAVGAVVE